MRHSAMNRRLLLEWLGDCADAGDAMPTDAAIDERFGFASIESARGLVTELAEAKQIVVTGFGRDRTITLPGRGTSTPAPSTADPVTDRLPPTVRRADPDIARVTRLIAALNEQAARKQRAAPDPVPAAQRAIEEPPMPKPQPTQRTSQPAVPPVGMKSVPTLSDTVQELLREAGGSIDLLIVKLIGRVADAEAASHGQRPEDAATIADLTKRAEQAEGKLAAMKALFA